MTLGGNGNNVWFTSFSDKKLGVGGQAGGPISQYLIFQIFFFVEMIKKLIC